MLICMGVEGWVFTTCELLVLFLLSAKFIHLKAFPNPGGLLIYI